MAAPKTLNLGRHNSAHPRELLCERGAYCEVYAKGLESFSIISARPRRFFDGWDAGCTKGTPDDVVKNVMPGVLTWRLLADQSA